jgi:hypothetical protein
MDGPQGEQMLFGFDRMRAAVDEVRLPVCAALSSGFSFEEPPVDPPAVSRYVAARPRGCDSVPLMDRAEHCSTT